MAERADTDVAGLGRATASTFVLPALLLIAAFLVFPALWLLWIGLTDLTVSGRTSVDVSFIGLGNYTRAIDDPLFGNSLLITLLYVLISAVIGQNGLGFALAWTLRTAARWIRTVVESVVLLAWILPSSVVAVLWIAMLDRDQGTVNRLLDSPGYAWLIHYPLPVLIVFNIWRGTAFSMLLYSAAASTVPPSQLESARLAGASGPQTLRDVVFPHLRGHILTNTLLISLWTFNDFTPYLLTRGEPNHRSETLPIFLYRQGIDIGALGYGAAASVLMLAINLVLALFYLRLLRRRAS
ncbi:carbohydrate ABC transporter permease [Nocardia arthritidis]|uniref:ABC transporter permease subunit n=1 Tax=Nocardia arthritidis TaxID=228602 RepID=A0A6G9Y968_9NOCA|nr:sugar ABC transporter permease [Nocardia arthritidis]QIS09769.1 ABC transporter permease subunit [Nocardia arthritidis]